MICFTKKIDDPPLPPLLWDKKIDNHSKVTEPASAYKYKNKSHSQHTDISFLNDVTLNAEVSMLRNTFKDTESAKVIVRDTGRAVGNQPIKRPKAMIKRKADVVPREVRLNPLH